MPTEKQLDITIESELEFNSKTALGCEHGYNGSCCCNCKHQLKLYCHPFNKPEFGRGSIMDQCGYACVNPEICEGKSAIFFDGEHGMCECWTERIPPTASHTSPPLTP
jgi:hypothetical protein